MKTRIIEAGQTPEGGCGNWGKFLIGTFDLEETRHPSHMPGATSTPLLKQRGWDPKMHFMLFDLETGEGALFRHGGSAYHDLRKKRIWVCPMFEPFLEWLYTQPIKDLHKLPHLVTLPDAPFDSHGYRREGQERRKRERRKAPAKNTQVKIAAEGDEDVLQGARTLADLEHVLDNLRHATGFSADTLRVYLDSAAREKAPNNKLTNEEVLAMDPGLATYVTKIHGKPVPPWIIAAAFGYLISTCHHDHTPCPKCSTRRPNLAPEELAQLRPVNYEDLSAGEMWEMDKCLGILDWEGAEVEDGCITCKRRLPSFGTHPFCRECWKEQMEARRA